MPLIAALKWTQPNQFKAALEALKLAAGPQFHKQGSEGVQLYYKADSGTEEFLCT